jgi:hypothetical protein
MVIEYEPAGVPVPIPITSDVPAEPLAGGVTDGARVQVMLLVPHAPPVVRFTVELNPLAEVTVTVPLEVPPVPALNVNGEADAEMPKSAVAAPVQLASLKDPIAVLQA